MLLRKVIKINSNLQKIYNVLNRLDMVKNSWKNSLVNFIFVFFKRMMALLLVILFVFFHQKANVDTNVSAWV